MSDTLNHTRRTLLKALLTGAACGLSPMAFAEKSRHLVAGQSYQGGRITQRANEAGFPDPNMGGMGAMTLFVFPVAVAVTPMRDIFIADAGLQAIFRYDPMLDAMNTIRGVRVTQQTRLAAAPDGTIAVANGMSAPMVRVSRTGRLLQTIDAQLGGGVFYDEVVVDAGSGRYYGLDKVQRRLEEIMPHGRGGVVMPQGLIPEQPTAMAMDGPNIYIAGRACQCIAAIDTFGSRNMEVMAEDIGQATALAAGDGWLAVADMREREIRLWRQGALLAEADFASLGLNDPRGMSIAQQTLYVADGAGRRVASFRLRA
ncbi:hypothetical protein LZ012_09180 [Dechloromonas sp. XY25]|uniref:Uncharacterized protein n=1 Tax=Dechloromonas hankyongensis TaxID=2908002 RepID=A0ABS9K1X6_9RHOO|nr:hypothetical protein [Dechloromonas hankyongensis]MCG2577169.1 hypothetical protein [Dechloromonas hankyongensis]